MLTELFHNSLSYFTNHPMLNALAHSAGGFGLAVIIQEYTMGNSIIPVWVAWLFVALSTVIHIYSFQKPKSSGWQFWRS